MTVQVASVRFEHQRQDQALGVGEAAPRISWRFTSDDTDTDWIQESYELERGDVSLSSPEAVQGTETGYRQVVRVASDQNVLVPWPWSPLRSGEAVKLRLRAWGAARRPGGQRDENAAQPTPWSPWTSVEAGLLTVEDWNDCSLIESAAVDREAVAGNKPHRPAYFRSPQFSISSENKAIRKARLYITAHGVYEAHINGHKVGDQALAPGWTSYGHRLLYQTFDVGPLLNAGAGVGVSSDGPGAGNVLGVVVGEGWYCGRLGWSGGKRNLWGTTMGVMAKLVVTYTDGTTATVVATDKRWECCNTGPLVTSELYDGELYDERLEQRGWSTPVAGRRVNDDGDGDGEPQIGSWAPVVARAIPDPARLKAPDGPPVRIMEELAPQKIWTSPGGKTIIDFGQNLVGWTRVCVDGPRDHTVTLTHTEVLEHGEVATRPLRFAAARDTLILAGGGRRSWQPTFTFHGFRYVQVENWPSHHGDGGLIDPADVRAVVVHTDMERTGWFDCSEPLINRLHENAVWSMKGNFLSVPTDCPQRDERLGWTGDLLMFCNTANFLYDSYGMLRSWLRDVTAEQMCDGTGLPPLYSPNIAVRPKSARAVWSDSVVLVPWYLFHAFGDARILQEQYASMKAWIDVAIPRRDDGLWDPSLYQLGDWLDPMAPESEPAHGRTDAQFVANAFLLRITDVMALIASQLGLVDESKSYEQSAASLRRVFAAEYITANGRVAPDSQTALALTIHFDLFPTVRQRDQAAERLRQLIQTISRFKIATGFAGTPFIGHALTATGQSQLFYRMLLHKKCPSWLYPVTMGATTIWERWDSMLPDGTVNPGDMTSFNHMALGSVAEWMHKVMGGLSPAEPGWKKILVRPIPGGTITHARVSHLTPYGTAQVAWHLTGSGQDQTLNVRVSIPPNTTAEVILPGCEDNKTVGSGVHEFGVPYEAPLWPPLPSYPPYIPHDDDEP